MLFLKIGNNKYGDIMDMLRIFGRTILVLILLFILTKIMGKKQVSQLSLFDYIIGITIGSIALQIFPWI